MEGLFSEAVRRRDERMERGGEEEPGAFEIPSARSVQSVSCAGQTGNLEEVGRDDLQRFPRRDLP